MEIYATVGSNNFSMNKGSFNYKEKHGKYVRVDNTEDFFLDQRVENALLHTKLVCRSGHNPYNRFKVIVKSTEGEHLYGCGETYSKFDLKNEVVRIWVAEHQNSKRIAGKMVRQKLTGKHPNYTLPFKKYESYYAQPTFLSSDRYFIHVLTNSYAEFDFTIDGKIIIYLQELPDFYIGRAESFEALATKLAGLIGKQRELPKHLQDGGIMAVQCGPSVIDEKLKKAKDAGALINGIWSQDWCGCRRTDFGYQVMWNWKYDSEIYPDLPQHIARWKNEGVYFYGYINPFMAIEKELYKEASEKGYCVKDKDGKDYLVTITTFPAAMIDFTNPDAYNWYKEIIKKNMIDIGMAGWMADFGEYLPTDAVLFSGESAEVKHNEWPAIWAKLNREAIEEAGKTDEIFFFTRAGSTGTVDNSAMMWTGDQHVDWSVDDGLPSVIPATLSLAVSGFGLAHSDVGGYTTIMNMNRSKELLMRWEEMNVFSPLFRSHEGNRPAKNVQLTDDDELLASLARCTQMYVRLKDYTQKLIAETAEKGIPVMRPLFYYYEEEQAYTEKTEYLYGRDILVAPVIKEKAISREVYLPDDTWIHVWSGKEYKGGTYTVDAPIGQIPVFVRKDCEKAARLVLTIKGDR